MSSLKPFSQPTSSSSNVDYQKASSSSHSLKAKRSKSESLRNKNANFRRIDRTKVEIFAKDFKKFPTLKRFNEAQFLAAHIPKLIQSLEGENEIIRAQYAKARYLKKVALIFLNVFNFNPLMANRLKINSLKQLLKDLQVGLKKISPDHWSSQLLPKALPAHSWSTLLKIPHELPLSHDLTAQQEYYIWDGQTWQLLPQDYEVMIHSLKQKGSVDSMSEAKALFAATQDTFNTIALELSAKGQQLIGVNNKVYFAVQEGKVRMYAEASATITMPGQIKVKPCSLYALYNPQEEANHIQLRLV